MNKEGVGGTMSTKVRVSFPVNEKTIAVEKEISELENISQTINDLLAEIGPLSGLGKATSQQLRAVYGKALERGWERERIQRFLEERFGTSDENEIIGKVDKERLSSLIDEIGGAIETPGMATATQMRALWGKALGNGWNREEVKQFLEKKLGTSVENDIVGKIERDRLSSVIDELGTLEASGMGSPGGSLKNVGENRERGFKMSKGSSGNRVHQ
ncbi:MAG: hypothetical protein ACP5E9_04295 [Candidatus Methanospirareceae archaeon]